MSGPGGGGGSGGRVTVGRIVRVALAAALVVPPDAAAQTAPAPTAAADFVAKGPVEPLPEEIARAVAGLTPEAIAAHVAFLASESLAGRGLGDRGLDAALEYAAASLALSGVAAAGGVGRFQAVPLREISSVTGELLVDRRQGDGGSSRLFAAGVDCLLPALPAQSLTAGVVFAGYGIREPQLGRDDLEGLDLRGKVALVVAGLPEGSEWQTDELEERYNAEDPDDRYTARVDLARSEGAVAVLVVETDEWAAHLARRAEAEARAYLPLAAADEGGDPPLVTVSPAVAEALLGVADRPDRPLRAERPRELPRASVRIVIRSIERLLSSRNVLGVIPGTDPALRDAVVMLGAHVDHLGRSGDVIYPGADDNASGVAALLEIARAFTADGARPRRTVAFAVWTGEEEGKLGSGHYVRNPVWPLDRTTYLNLDMVGYPWLPEDIRARVSASGLEDGEAFLASFQPADYVEPGLPTGSPHLDAALRRAARGTGLALHLDRTDGTGGGSDYRDFARAGVPFIRFCDNYSPFYHSPDDTAEALEPRQALRLTRLALATAWLLADR